MTRAIVAAVLFAWGVAAADTVLELPRTKARLELPDGWQRTDHPQLVAVYRHPRGSVLVVTRSDAPNGDAWSSVSTKRLAHAAAFERGVRTHIPGITRVTRSLDKLDGVPALDLEAVRDDGATVIMRALMFRTYTLTLAIEVPAKGDVAVARAIARKLAPTLE